MKYRYLCTGKSSGDSIIAETQKYLRRISHYFPFQYEEIAISGKKGKLSIQKTISLESELQMKKITPSEQLYLLDDKGKMMSSIQFASFIQKGMNAGKSITFLSGGAFGFGKTIADRAEGKISLSRMTFSHQMVRVIFLEQLYRAGTIIKGESYHHS